MESGRLPVTREGRAEATPMRSPVNWALLGLIIERPSYAYNLAQRFERRYGDTLPLSNIGHVYTALGALSGRSLVEEIPGTREGRQPRPRYRATAGGVEAYREWLVEQVGEDRRRRELFVKALAALVGEPEQALEIVYRYEQQWLREAMGTSIAGAHDDRDAPSDIAALLQGLLEEDSRLSVGARLAWVEYARAQLTKLSSRP